MKIKLKNFQSFRSAEFEFSPGLALITGPTNSGKTALFRALLSLLTNPAEASDFINGSAIMEEGDSAEMLVGISDEDIPNIEFHRTKSKAWYIVNGKKYAKLGRSNIFDVYPDLHKKFVFNPDDPRKVLNFHTENNLAFPFDRSDTEMFKLFEKIFNITDTRAIIDTMRKEEDEVNFKLNQNFAEKQKLQDEVTEINSSLQTVNKELLASYVSQYKHSSYIVDQYGNKLRTIVGYAPFLKTMQELPKISDIDDEIYNRAVDLEKKLQECQLKSSYITNYTDVSLTPVEEDLVSPILALREKIENVQSLSSKYRDQEAEVQKYTEELSHWEEILKKFDMCPLCGHKL